MDSSNDRTSENTVAQTSHRRYILLIVVSIGILYGQTLRFDFVTYDDYELVYQNGDFLSHLSNIVTSFATHVFTTHRAESGYYRPILLVSYILDYQVWGLNPFGYHLTNILLHCCSAIVVFLFLERLLKKRLAALLGSLLFALHPIQTESVAWIAGRNDVLLGLFVSIMLLNYLYYREGPAKQKTYLLLSVISFLLALFTKESAAFYLLLIPLLELCKRETSAFSKKNLFMLLPFFAVLFVYLFARWNVVGEIIGAERLYGATPIIDRFRQMPAIISEHCAMIVLPIQLSIVHSVDQLRWLTFPWTIAAIIIPLLLVGATWYCWRKDGILCFGLLWFLVGLLPVLGMFPVAVPLLEHRLYLPLIGIAIVVARISMVWNTSRTRMPAVTVVFGLIIVILAVMSYLRLPVWNNSATLWTDAIAKAPTVSRSYFNLAGFYFERQQYDSTINLMKKYVELKPDDFLGYSKLRQTYYLAGRYDEAAHVSRLIINHNPMNPNRYFEAGMMYEQLQQFDSAAALYTEGLRIDSNVFDLHFHLGLVYQRTNNARLAEPHFQRAVEIAPRDVRALYGLGACYASLNENLRAIEMIERGMNLNAPPLDIVKLLHQLYIQTGQPEKAQRLAEQFHF